MKTNILIISREEEDRFLSICDGTCVEGSKCKCITDMGTVLSGSSVYGSNKCILCLRSYATENYKKNTSVRLNYYINIKSEYPIECYIDYENNSLGVFNGIYGPFVRYNKKQYRKMGDDSIEQYLPYPNIQESWITINFNVDNGYTSQHLDKMMSDVWELCYCPNNKCKNNLLSCKNIRFAVGIEKTRYNLFTDETRCVSCNHLVNFIQSNPLTNLALFDNSKYMTRCMFCCTLIDYRPNETIQCCDPCTLNVQKDLVSNVEVCFKCNNSIVKSKRLKGAGNSYIITKDNNQTYVLYLCKNHKLKGGSTKKHYDEEEFFKIIL